MSEDKKKLEMLDAILKKRCGDRYYSPKEKDNKLESINWISTGYYALDYVCGKGIPEGKLIQLTGWESVGKSLVAQEIAAKFVSLGKEVAWLEAGEASFNREFADCLQLNVDSIRFIKSKTAEEAVEVLRDMLKIGALDLIIIDSIAGFTPEKEIEDDLSDANMALLARLLSKALKQFKYLMDEHKTTLIVINQIRSKLGISYGNPETLCAGNALKYYTDVLLQLSRIKVIENKKEAIGIITKIKNKKNRCANPFREKEITIRFPYEENGIIKAGIDIIEDLIPEAINQKVIVQAGAYYTWREFPIDSKSNTNKIKSKDSVIEFFKLNPHLLESLKEDLLNNNNNNYESTAEIISEEEEEYEETV